MGARENKIEKYLEDEVKRVFGGETRKWISPGHDGVHDRILFISGLPAVFVEVKTSNGSLTLVQMREHKRLKDTGTTSIFEVVYGKNDVDLLINRLWFTHPLRKKQQLDRLNRKNQKSPVVVHNV